MKETFVFGHSNGLKRFISWLWTLDLSRQWRVTVELVERMAGTDHEAVLRGKERQICRATGNDMATVHDELLKRHYGIEWVRIGKRWVERPARRTRTGKNPLTASEIREHIMFVEAFAAADLGINLA